MNGFSAGEEDSLGAMERICCLVESGIKCNKTAGNASYSNKIEKIVAQRRLSLRIDKGMTHTYICEDHKRNIQQARSKRRRKDSEDDSNETDTDTPEVDLYQLQVNTLRRYKKHFKIPARPGINKAQMADTLMKHFKTIPVNNQKDIVTYFVYTVKTNANKLEQKNGLNNENT